LEHIIERWLDFRCADLISLEAAGDDALDGRGLPTHRDERPKGEVNGLAIRRGPSELLRLPELVLVDVDGCDGDDGSFRLYRQLYTPLA
jgi:hypothetical protein